MKFLSVAFVIFIKLHFIYGKSSIISQFLGCCLLKVIVSSKIVAK